VEPPAWVTVTVLGDAVTVNMACGGVTVTVEAPGPGAVTVCPEGAGAVTVTGEGVGGVTKIVVTEGGVTELEHTLLLPQEDPELQQKPLPSEF